MENMKNDTLLTILFDLFQERKITATELAKKYGLSTRTIYRYVRRLAAFIPVEITRGRNGGVYLADEYRLPCEFLTEEEYAATKKALALAYAQTGELCFLSARRKFNAKQEE